MEVMRRESLPLAILSTVESEPVSGVQGAREATGSSVAFQIKSALSAVDCLEDE